ncbi:MAG: MFS transporter [Alphaproteobacteria bacterium]|nr:MFS transporter [Alphaproteobacteria bacterium]
MSSTTEDAPVTPRATSDFYKWYVVLFLTVASTLSFIDRQILGVMIGPVKRDLGINDEQIGLLIGFAFTIFYTIITVPMAWLADRYSRRMMIGFGIFFWSLMTALSGLAKTYGQLFGARDGVGVGEATLGPAAFSMMSDYFSKERLPIAIGIFQSAPFIGVGLAFILGGPLVEYLESIPPIEAPIIGEILSWQMAFFLVGIPGILMAFFIFTVKEPVRRGRSKMSEATGDIPVKEIGRFIAQRKWFFIFHFTAFIMLSIQGWALFAWVLEFFIRSHDLSRGVIGQTYGMIALFVGFGGSIAAGAIATRMLRKGTADATLRLVMISALGLTPLAVLFPQVDSATLAFVMLVPITFFMSWPSGLGTTALQVIVPNELRGRVIAFYLLVVNFTSYTLGPYIGGAINTRVFNEGVNGLGNTLSLMAAFTYPIAAICTFIALRFFRDALEKAKEWEEDEDTPQNA